MTGITIAAGFSAGTVLLLLVLGGTWIQSYRTYRTPLVLGLVAFCIVLFVENLIALYFYFISMEDLYVSDPEIATLVAVMRGLQFLGVAFFTYVTLE